MMRWLRYRTPAAPEREFTARRIRGLAVPLLIAAVACSSGQNVSNFQKPQIQADMTVDPPPQTDRVVYFDHIVKTGDSIELDVMVRDTQGNLIIDDADLVLRYDTTFIQVAAVRGQNILFGSCNTINPVCLVNSPICTDNRAAANGGGERFCRGDSTKSCATNADCPGPGNACGSYGNLEAAFAVLTGPKLCSNNSAVGCATALDCRFCTLDRTQTCTGNPDCTGTCQAGNCTRPAGRTCVTNADCADTCDLGTCLGCPEVTVDGAQRLATITLRVVREGTGDLRLAFSAGPPGPTSVLRRNTVEQTGIVFHPGVDLTDPQNPVLTGNITVSGSL